MSSPITVGVRADAVVTLLAAAAIRAGQAVADGYAEADRLRGQHAESALHRAAAQQTAEQHGLATLQAEIAASEARLQRLASLGAAMGLAERVQASQPQAPAHRDQASLAAYARGLAALADSLQQILLTEAGQHASPALDTALASFTHAADAPRQTASARLLARSAHLGEVPIELARLADELDACLPGERAELLATELRLRIQQQLKAAQAKALEAATALVIEQSLKDLGYQVEEVAHTLYVEGGAVHFRRPGWGDYMVRMRLDTQRHSANFNVIRAVNEGDNERSVRDHLAEDRWCSEFPALMQALEARGVMFNVTRRIEPGDLPVQLVNRDKLPQFADEETRHSTQTLRAREIK